MKQHPRRPLLRGPALKAGLLFSLVIGMVPAPASAVSITIESTDAPGKGFNDPTPVAPVGGNPGTTLGEQRRFLFQYAADAWGLRLKGTVPIIVSSSFQALGGTASSAILGFTSPTTLHRDFPGAPLAATWYVSSLTNQLAGSDQNDLLPAQCPEVLVSGACPEMVSVYNSDVDGATVLGGVGFYYGIDANGGYDLDFLDTLLHEMGHGLGFLDLLDPNDGTKFYDYDDAYIVHLEDPNINPKQVPKMSDLQRIKAQVDGVTPNPPHPGLVWTGANVEAGSGALTSGRRASDGAVQIFAPEAYQSGSSVAHFDTAVSPNELMEPYITTPPTHKLTLTLALMRDLGWDTLPVPLCGDANNDRSIVTSDALLVLKGAVGTAHCPYQVCDANQSGKLTALDALLVLKSAVGQPVSLSCRIL